MKTKHHSCLITFIVVRSLLTACKTSNFNISSKTVESNKWKVYF